MHPASLRRVAYAPPLPGAQPTALNCLRSPAPARPPESTASPLRFHVFRPALRTQTCLRDVNDSTPNCLRSCTTEQPVGNPSSGRLRESRQSIAGLRSRAESRGRVPDRDGESSASVQASRFPRFKPRLDSSPGKRLRLIWALSSEDSKPVSLRLSPGPPKTLDGRGGGFASGPAGGLGGRLRAAHPEKPLNPDFEKPFYERF